MDIRNETILSQWQGIVEIMAKIIRVPSAIITRFDPPYVEVVKTSRTDGNPYHEAQKATMTGHYCEAIYRRRDKIHIRDAREDPLWQTAPELDYGMVSYLGFPIFLPDGMVFGTICVLDTKANDYSEDYEALIRQFKALVEAHIRIIEQKREIESKISEIKTLRGIIPICASCKNIRNDDGYWERVEKYVKRHSEADFSHSICPDCARKLYPELYDR